jgi:signal transduction histidine kinase
VTTAGGGSEDFAALTALLPEPHLLVGGDGRIAAHNGAAEAAFGGAPLGRTFGELGDGAGAYFERCAASDGPVAGELVTAAGKRFRLDGGRLSGGAALVRLTPRDAEEGTRFLESFIGMLGHDLKNPIGAVLTAVSFVLKSGVPEQQARMLQRAASSAERMNRMIDQLLDVTRIRLGAGIPLNRRASDLGEVCRYTVEEVLAAHPGRSVEVQAERIAAEVDPDRLGQVVSTLVSNAIVHGAPDRLVRVSLVCDEEGLLLQVHNQGAPIAPEVLPTLFEPAAPAAGDRRPARRAALGFGMYIARYIVAAHGGTLEAHSSADEGTTFQVRLPR